MFYPSAKTIRKRRRDRTRSRIANQKRLDAIASKELNENMGSSFETWGGTHCPDCAKPLPSRAFFCGYHTGNSYVRISIGSSVSSEFCHADKTQCYSESTKTDPYIWKLANDYIPTKKELKQLKKEREYRENRAKKTFRENHEIRTYIESLMHKYAVSKQTFKNGDVVFAVREFYPNKQGELTSWTADEITPVGESIDDLRWMLNRMLEALDGEIVDIGDEENGTGQPN